MKPPLFAYRDPSSLQEALSLLAANPEARPLAGGQSLVPMLNFRLAHPPMIVDLNRVEGLDRIEINADGAIIGAMIRQADAERHAGLAESWPLIGEALRHVGHIQTRNRGTIGGSLAHNDPAAELPAVMLALDAIVTVRSEATLRRVAASDFFVSALTTSLESRELLVSIHVPRPPPRTGYGFAELARRQGDFALAAAAVAISRADGGHARIVVTGMGQGPQRMTAAEEVLLDGGFGESAIAQAAAAVREAVAPVDDLHAPAWYRRKIAGVMTARACRQAVDAMAG